jgi:hypothetical protein
MITGFPLAIIIKKLNYKLSMLKSSKIFDSQNLTNFLKKTTRIPYMVQVCSKKYINIYLKFYFLIIKLVTKIWLKLLVDHWPFWLEHNKIEKKNSETLLLYTEVFFL